MENNKEHKVADTIINILLISVLLPTTIVVEGLKIIWFTILNHDNPFLLLQVMADKKICPSEKVDE